MENIVALLHGDCLEMLPKYVQEDSVKLVFTYLPGRMSPAGCDFHIDLPKLFTALTRVLASDGIMIFETFEPSPMADDIIKAGKEYTAEKTTYKLDFHGKLSSRTLVILSPQGGPAKKAPEIAGIHKVLGPRYHWGQTPISVIKKVLEYYTKPDDIILDPCLGSGSTLVAAILTGRQVIGIEINDEQHAIALRRMNEALCHNGDS